MAGVPIGNPAPYAIEGILEGLSGRQILAEIREAGGAIGDARFYDAYRAAQQSLSELQSVSDIQLNVVPAAGDFIDWSTKGEGYAYQIAFSFTDETGLETIRQAMVVSADAITPAEAIGEALEQFADADPDKYDFGTLNGPTTIELYRMNGTYTGPDAGG